jgi:DNA-binding MarR family transcriptional regulator
MTTTPQEQDTIQAIINLQRTLNKTLRQASTQEGVTPQQATILRILNHEGQTPMNKIALQLQVSKPNITGIADRLEKKGLIEKSENQKDRRSTTIQLSPKGKELQTKINQNYTNALRAGLKELTPAEQEKLTSGLKKFSAEISQI